MHMMMKSHLVTLEIDRETMRRFFGDGKFDVPGFLEAIRQRAETQGEPLSKPHLLMLGAIVARYMREHGLDGPGQPLEVGPMTERELVQVLH
jgi:hypothetical protein